MPPELAFVLLLNPANDDLMMQQTHNPAHTSEPRPEKQRNMSKNLPSNIPPKTRYKPPHKHKQARARGAGLVTPPAGIPACDTFTRVIFPRFGRTSNDEFRWGLLSTR